MHPPGQCLALGQSQQSLQHHRGEQLFPGLPSPSPLSTHQANALGQSLQSLQHNRGEQLLRGHVQQLQRAAGRVGNDSIGFGARLAAPQHGAGEAVGQAVKLVAHEGEEGADHEYQA